MHPPAAAKPAPTPPQRVIAFEVRDYECDMDHVVNNAVYLNYLEHARHKLLESSDLQFGELSRRGISLVVTRIEIDFRASLHSGDAFVVHTVLRRKGRLRLQFEQRIVRRGDERLIANAVVLGTALNAQGRPEIPAALDAALARLVDTANTAPAA